MSAVDEQTGTGPDAEQADAGQADTELDAVAPAAQRIEVVGDASPEQVAALVAVLSAAGGDDEDEAAGPASRWSSRERLVRAAVHPSPGGWRASAFPR